MHFQVFWNDKPNKPLLFLSAYADDTPDACNSVGATVVMEPAMAEAIALAITGKLADRPMPPAEMTPADLGL